jgi:hypothetical protein
MRALFLPEKTGDDHFFFYKVTNFFKSHHSKPEHEKISTSGNLTVTEDINTGDYETPDTIGTDLYSSAVRIPSCRDQRTPAK